MAITKDQLRQDIGTIIDKGGSEGDINEYINLNGFKPEDFTSSPSTKQDKPLSFEQSVIKTLQEREKGLVSKGTLSQLLLSNQ